MSIVVAALFIGSVLAGGGNPSTTTTTTASRTTTKTTTATTTATTTTTAVPTTTTPTTTSTSIYTVVEPKPTAQGDINYSGGNVMANGVNVYGIFYGTHSDKTQSLIKTFVQGLGQSDWWTTSMQYTGSNGAINNKVTWAGSYSDNYSLGKNLPSGSISKIIDAAVKAAGWPKDSNGIYTVFTAPDVAEKSGNGGFCTDYCGYHGITTSSNLKLAMIGDATRCPGTLPPPGGSTGTAGCMARYWRNQTDPAYSVNGDQHADAMVSILAHEITETASDYANAWRDGSGYENADKCAYYYLNVKGIGATSPYNGAYNVNIGGTNFLIQSNWHPTKQGCVLKASDTPPSLPVSNAPVLPGPNGAIERSNISPMV
ncbi:hypothetical protein HDV03_001166 [Kappamyces sp. JEL0829]|nr:hypothetical protein HDV03_001166 [Kappamyces sp. JEL0829]